MKRLSRRLLVLMALPSLLWLATPAQAMYQCKDANGDTAFQDKPCEGTQTSIKTLPETPTPMVGTVSPIPESPERARHEAQRLQHRKQWQLPPQPETTPTTPATPTTSATAATPSTPQTARIAPPAPPVHHRWWPPVAHAPDLTQDRESGPLFPVYTPPPLPTTPIDPAAWFYVGFVLVAAAIACLVIITERQRNQSPVAGAGLKRGLSVTVLVLTPLALLALLKLQPGEVFPSHWSTPVKIDVDNRLQRQLYAPPETASPQVVDAHGTTTLLTDDTSTGQLVLVAKRKSAGGFWDAPVAVAVDATSPPHWIGNRPAAVVDSAGNVTAVWIQLTPQQDGRVDYVFDLMTSRYNAGSGQWSSPVSLGYGPLVRAGMFHQPVVDAQGNVTVFWGYDGVLHASRYDHSRDIWDSVSIGNQPYLPTIVQTPDGDVFAGWSDENGIVVARYDHRRYSWLLPNAPFRHLKGWGNELSRPKMVVDGAGNIILAWYESQSPEKPKSPAIYASRYSISEHQWSPARLLGRASGPTRLSMLADPQGDVTVAWLVTPYTPWQVPPMRLLPGLLVTYYHQTHENAIFACHYDHTRQTWSSTDTVAVNASEPLLSVDNRGAVNMEWIGGQSYWRP